MALPLKLSILAGPNSLPHQSMNVATHNNTPQLKVHLIAGLEGSHCMDSPKHRDSLADKWWKIREDDGRLFGAEIFMIYPNSFGFSINISYAPIALTMRLFH
jgi:hypothetical protein